MTQPQKYLIIKTKEEGVVYAGEGSFNDWKKKLEGEPKKGIKYSLRQLEIGKDSQCLGYLQIRMHQINPIGYGSDIFDYPIKEMNTDWASIPLDEKVAELLGNVLEDTNLIQSNEKNVDELEEKLLGIYRTGVEKGLEELKEGKEIGFNFYSGAMDLVWDYLITRKDNEISIKRSSVPQKNDYNVPGKEVIAGRPLGTYKLTTERLYFDLGKDLERWKIAYDALKQR